MAHTTSQNEINGKTATSLTKNDVSPQISGSEQLLPKLKEQIGRLAEWHKQESATMSAADSEASFSVMGKVAVVIDVVEQLSKKDATESELATLIEAIEDGKAISTQISKFLES